MKVVVIASLASSLVGFRGELLRAMTDRGHTVLAFAPDERERTTTWLAGIGVRFDTVPMTRAGLDPIEDLRTLRAIHRSLREQRPDVVLVYTAKPVIYGLIAARLAGVPNRVALITGRGSALAGAEGLRRRVLARVMRTLYAVALRGAHLVLFQNSDDEELFRRSGLVGRHQRRALTNGSGVDLEHFAPTPLPDGPLTFLMFGRLLREKGIFEYVEAARLVKARHPSVRFRLVGKTDPNPSSISEAELERLQDDGTIEYLEWVSDVRPVISDAHVIVLPSYHEGMPHSVLEGMSMGRAIVTTDVPGCRQTIEPGRNGILVPVRDPASLAEAMRRLVEHRELVPEMGAQSRQMAEEQFDVHKVNAAIIEAMGL